MLVAMSEFLAHGQLHAVRDRVVSEEDRYRENGEGRSRSPALTAMRIGAISRSTAIAIGLLRPEHRFDSRAVPARKPLHLPSAGSSQRASA
jgi:hypothetical protein